MDRLKSNVEPNKFIEGIANYFSIVPRREQIWNNPLPYASMLNIDINSYTIIIAEFDMHRASIW